MSDALERAVEGEATSADLVRAMVYEDYGEADVLHLSRRATPRRAAGRVKIRVHASSVNPVDYRLRRGGMKRLLLGGFPRIPGFDLAGMIEKSDAEGDFRTGDRAFGTVGFFTGFAPMMNEPPPYGIMVATLLVVLLGIQRTKSTT